MDTINGIEDYTKKVVDVDDYDKVIVYNTYFQALV